MKNLYFFLYGFSSLFFQTYFLRETIFLSGGNEITFGFFFFFWFLGIFSGALFGRNYKGEGKDFLNFFSLFPFISFLVYVFVFILNYFIPIPLGQEPNFTRALLSCFGLSFFTGFYIGFLFPLSLLCKKDLPYLFFFESLGSFFSGITLTLILLKTLSPYKGFLILSTLFLLFLPKKFKIFFLLPLILIFFEKNFSNLRYKSIGILGKVQKEIQSPYQNIIISSFKETKSIYLNGRFFSQYPSSEAVELRYFPFLMLPEKLEKVLIYGFPLGNEKVFENLEIKNLKLLETDPFLVKEVVENKKYYLKEDIRVFLGKKGEKFDLIIMDIPPPVSILSSRLMSMEFFGIVKGALKERGIFIFYLNLPYDFWGEEIERYSSSLYSALKRVFPMVKIGISENPFFICSFKIIELGDSFERGKLVFKEKKNFSPEILNYFFPEERIKYLESKLLKKDSSPNFDKKPFYFLQILKLKSKVEKDFLFYKFFSLPKGFLSIFIIVPLFYLKRKYRIFFPVFSNGFIGIGLYLILSFTYQVKYGIFYSYVGLLSSLFMLGLAISSPVANFLFKRDIKLFYLELILIFYLFSLFFLDKFSPFLFYLFFFLAGFFSGMPFTFIGLLRGGDQRAGGDMEAQDHLGASFGALISGTLLVPFLGIYASLLSFIFIKIYSILLNLKSSS